MKRTVLAVVTVFTLSTAPAAADEVDPIIIDAINRYFEAITTVQGNFIASTDQGGTEKGRFLVRRPGRLRFEYSDPTKPLIVADGTWVGEINRRSGALDRKLLSRSPLGAVLSADVDVVGSGAIQKVEREPGRIRITSVDPANPGGGSVTMVFSTSPIELLKWIVSDPQGRMRTITFNNVVRDKYIEPREFVIDDPAEGGVIGNGDADRG